MSLPSLRIDVLTLFPALFDGFLSQSIVRRAIDKNLVAIERWDLRDWASGKHKQVDSPGWSIDRGAGTTTPRAPTPKPKRF